MKYVCCRIRIGMLISCNFILWVSLAFLSEVILFSITLIKFEFERSIKKSILHPRSMFCSILIFKTMWGGKSAKNKTKKVSVNGEEG